MASGRSVFPGAARARPAAGFTLVELMVALGLAAIISVSIMFISSQARLTYEETVKKVDVYNRFRYAFHTLEKDLKAWIPTSDLEFYIDGVGRGGKLNGHWNEGEEIRDKADEMGPGLIDGGTPGEYDEFAYVTERHYVSREPFQLEDKVHDAYQLYFRTFTYVDGDVREAQVEYLLADPLKNERGLPKPPDRVEPTNVSGLALYKVIRYQHIHDKTFQKLNDIDVKRRVIEVATNVTDFRVEYLVDRGNRAKVSPGFRTPEQDYKEPVELVTRPRIVQNAGPKSAYRKTFGYGSLKIEEMKLFPLAVGYKARRGDDQLARVGNDNFPVLFGFQNLPEISFAELTPGDKIYVSTQAGGGAQVGQVNSAGQANSAFGIQFPASGDYTIKTNRNGLLEFEETIDSTGWVNPQQSGLHYKASFIPAAVRVTLRMVDDKGESPKTMQRTIWLRRRSR
jgi:prepilin-type N-terminal cleavage/methylation domain-containing protein